MDRELFWKLLKPHHPKAEAFCRRLAGNRDDGDDLYQEGLLTAMRKFHTLKEPVSFQAWLFRILVNTFKNRKRKAWWRHFVPIPNVEESSWGSDPGERYDAYRWLEMALSALKPEDRAIVLLFEIEGWTIAELSDMFSKPEGTIKARLARARGKMRLALERRLPKQETNSTASEERYALQRSDSTDK
jgi:RNA polymerase sigma-70 factor (ECF subfamily)